MLSVSLSSRFSHDRYYINVSVYTARCYADRGYMSQYVVRLSVRLPVCDVQVCFFHKGWNTSKIIA